MPRTTASRYATSSETVRLSETGPNSGVFAGYLPTAGGAAAIDDCVLQGAPKSSVAVTYTDPGDAGDSAQAVAALDPVQRVFESRTGTAINGALVELVHASSGLPATVYGNDGVSEFPSAIEAGGIVTGINVKGQADSFSRKRIDELTAECAVTAEGLLSAFGPTATGDAAPAVPRDRLAS